MSSLKDHPRTRFALPDDLAATEPPEARGLHRDGVRLLAAAGDRLEHARFADLGRFLEPGDLLVVNTSATRAAAVDATIRTMDDDGPGPHRSRTPVVVHFSTRLDDGSWVVEVRTAPAAGRPIRTLTPGTRIELPGGPHLLLLAPEPADQDEGANGGGVRLWRTQPLDPEQLRLLLARHGRPIRYGYLPAEWPLASYQTVFATPGPVGPDRPDRSDGSDPGAASAEMPSAGRPFSTELVTRLAGRGVLFAPITLYAGVSSQESGEPPAAERFQVPARTAALVNWTRQNGGRVIAVGTTATRALESAVDARDQARTTQARTTQARAAEVRAAEGWTELVLGPDRPVHVVDGLITGLHDPDASHLLLLEAVAGPELVQRVYDAAVDQRYRWHEFGDSCLLLK